MQPDLVDRIYECSVVPELWPDVLDDIAALTDARGGLLFSARRTLHWTASEAVRDVFDEYVRDGWFQHCHRRVCLMSQAQPIFIVEHDNWTSEQLDNMPIYRDFFRPRGLGWSAGTGLQIPTGDNIVISMERDFDRGPVRPEHVALLNSLRPHLARSAFVSARLQLKRAEGASDVMAQLRLPAVLIDDRGVVIEANEMVDALGIVTGSAGNRVALTDSQANGMLAQLLAAVATVPDAPANSFPVRDSSGRASVVAHLVPIRRSAHDIFGLGHALLLFTPVSSERVPSVDLLKSLFDLTPSEARVASALAIGQTPEDIATEGGVAISTVRSQLRKVLEKTGCTRQADVAALLARIAIGPETTVG